MGELRAAVALEDHVDAGLTSSPPPTAARESPGRIIPYRRTEHLAPQPEVLSCRSIRDARGFLALEPAWRSLFAQSAGTAFQSWDFAVEWWRHFVINRIGGATGAYEIVVVTAGTDKIVGIAPFYVEHNLAIPVLGKTMQPFGASTAMEVMTDEPIALYRTGYEETACAAIQEHVMGSRDSWDTVIVRGARADAPAVRGMRFRSSGRFLELTRSCGGLLTVPLSSSWDAYRASLTKSMRDNIAYYPRRLAREIGGYQVRIARTPGEIEPATSALIALHRARARFSTGPAHYDHIATENQAAFLRAWFRRAAARGNLAIFTVEVNDAIVAAQAFVETPGRLSVYYSGFEEAFSRYSPLTILTAEAIRWAFSRSLGRVDFPPEDKAWKSRWNARQQGAVADTCLHRARPTSLARWIGRRAYLRVCPNPWAALGGPAGQRSFLGPSPADGQ